MRDEVDWTKVWVAAAFATMVVLVALIAAIWHYNYAIERAAIDAGLEQHATDRGTIWAAKDSKR